MKSEHVCSAHPDLYLHWAKFELGQGKDDPWHFKFLVEKLDKALAVIDSGLKTSLLRRNEKLQLAQLQLQTSGKLPNINPIVDISRLSSSTTVETVDDSQRTILNSNLFEPLPTPQSLSQKNAFFDSQNREITTTERDMHTFQPGFEDLKTTPQWPLPLNRLKKVGLGPPKREIVKTSTIESPTRRKIPTQDSAKVLLNQPQDISPFKMQNPTMHELRNSRSPISGKPVLANISISPVSHKASPASRSSPFTKAAMKPMVEEVLKISQAPAEEIEEKENMSLTAVGFSQIKQTEVVIPVEDEITPHTVRKVKVKLLLLLSVSSHH